MRRIKPGFWEQGLGIIYFVSFNMNGVILESYKGGHPYMDLVYLTILTPWILLDGPA
jgi:hypothetical protein